MHKPIDRAEEATGNASKLLDLARGKFGTLTQAEEKLFQAAVDGKIAEYSAEEEEDNDPAVAEKWGDERTLKADRIAWLCTDPHSSALVSYRGIHVKGARIDGALDLRFAKIPFSLNFKRSAFPGQINLSQAEVRALFLSGTHTGSIFADGVKVKGSVFLRNGFKAEGQVRLPSATIGDDLDCGNGQFTNAKGDALNAEGLKVQRNVSLHNGFKAEGEVSLLSATIGGDLNCEDGQFTNAKGRALSADRAKVEGSVFLRKGFKAEGEVRLRAATIGGDLECGKGQFTNAKGDALNAGGLKVEGSVFLCNGFKAVGQVSLHGATVDGHFIWIGVTSPEEATLNLRSAKIGILRDESDSLPESGKLYLHGLVYDEIAHDAPIDARTRLDWLHRQPTEHFRSQPYEQLAAVLRKGGHEADAKKILLEKEKDRARMTQSPFFQRCWHGFLGLTIGYGYRPWRAFWIGLMVVVLGWLLFGIGFRAGVMSPMKEGGYVSDSGGENLRLSENYPEPCALVYSLDMFVPLINLHQASYWLPNANREGKLQISEKLRLPISGSLLRFYLWFHIIMGWILTTLLVVGLTGLIRS